MVSSFHGLHTQLQLMSYKLWVPKIRRNAVSYDIRTVERDLGHERNPGGSIEDCYGTQKSSTELTG